MGMETNQRHKVVALDLGRTRALHPGNALPITAARQNTASITTPSRRIVNDGAGFLAVACPVRRGEKSISVAVFSPAWFVGASTLDARFGVDPVSRQVKVSTAKNQLFFHFSQGGVCVCAQRIGASNCKLTISPPRFRCACLHAERRAIKRPFWQPRPTPTTPPTQRRSACASRRAATG